MKGWNNLPRFLNAKLKGNYLIFFALIVGVIVGLLVAAFRIVLSYIEILTHKFYSEATTNVWYFITVLIFGVFSALISIIIVRKFAPEASGSGIQEIEGALDELRPVRWKRVIPVKFISSLFSLGSGFLLGREGPSVQIGANLGKMLKDILKLPEKDSNALISAGSAAGLAGAFNAPFSGIIFVIEEMHGHFKHTFHTLAAIMVASSTADLIVRLFIGTNPIIKIMIFPTPPLANIWLFILLGAIFAVIGFIFNKFTVLTLDFFEKLSKKGKIIGILIVGLIISLIGIYFPNMIGGGYDTISSVLSKSFPLRFLFFIFLVRIILTVFSYGIGLSGGIFAPLLTLGVVLGIAFAGFVQHILPGTINHPEIYAIAGMAAMFAASVRAPLTGLMLAVEMTSNFELLLPLIFTTVTASLLTAKLGNEPIYTILLRRTLIKQSEVNK